MSGLRVPHRKYGETYIFIGKRSSRTNSYNRLTLTLGVGAQDLVENSRKRSQARSIQPTRPPRKFSPFSSYVQQLPDCTRDQVLLRRAASEPFVMLKRLIADHLNT